MTDFDGLVCGTGPARSATCLAATARRCYRPSYRAADAADAWQRMLAWFRKYGVVCLFGFDNNEI
jgi:dienelactone hydrolase